MKNLIPIITISLGTALMGIGAYNLGKENIENGKLIIGFGAMMATFGGGFYLGRELEKKLMN